MQSQRTIKTPTFYRSLSILRDTVDEESRTVSLSFSSEEPVDRFFGKEVLSHDPAQVRLGRLNSGGPFLLNHNTDEQIGVVEEAFIGQDRKGRAVVRFSRSQRAEEIFRDVIDGIRKNVSVGYAIHRMVLQEERDGVETYCAVDWEPLEISSVPVPADSTVGIGRSKPEEISTIIENHQTRSITMPESNIENQTRAQEPAAPVVSVPDLSEAREKIRRDEISRVREILAIGEKHGENELARQFVGEGKAIEDFRAAVLEKITARANEKHVVNMPLSEKENQEYSVVRAMRFAAYGNKEDDRIEAEIHRQIEKQLGRQSRGIFIPMQIRAPLTTSVAGPGGGYTVATEMRDLITMLRNKMLVRAMGATVLSGLTSNVAFPRQIGSASLYWTGENPGVDVAESEASLDQITLSPKSAQATTRYSRQLIQQSSIDIENFVRNDLATINALGLDLAAIIGTGSGNQPRGILNVSGIGSVIGGVNGAAPAWGHIIDLEKEVAIDNAEVGNLGYLTNAKVRGKLKQTQKVPTYGNDFIWQDASESGFGMMNGYRVGCTNQVPSNLTKGTSAGICSAIIYGNWADLLIGEFGVLEIIVDPYAGKKQGLIEVTSLLMADIAVRHPESFAAMVDALTA